MSACSGTWGHNGARHPRRAMSRDVVITSRRYGEAAARRWRHRPMSLAMSRDVVSPGWRHSSSPFRRSPAMSRDVVSSGGDIARCASRLAHLPWGGFAPPGSSQATLVIFFYSCNLTLLLYFWEGAFGLFFKTARSFRATLKKGARVNKHSLYTGGL